MKEQFTQILYSHTGKVFGVAIGLIVGFIYLFFGLFKTIIFLAFVTLGLYIGSRIDQQEDLRDIIERFLPNHWR
ncbi:hypothetical protein BHU72_02360 [Desulfuribacillus stibiiarsenatis]|uniref:DUF2273 domain-containing protein n=1 Tax=Desulfuribacillus stibiiarsenatis TaxID=1390249 RepID=A0A1E5L6B3_9FIRM|nr:DUF2273 domain-containing protein [Desulfuribacillus stibiiarsenatis]OEH85661.1 hypothetical protein BHU72_02360 [Desulfuribacillus stibiiarsenatis]